MADDGAAPKPKRKTRRGTRGGRGRKRKTAAVAAGDGAQAAGAPEREEPDRWDYVPMSEWGDELDSR